ncbi:transposase [Streptosporangium sp. NPDC051022]|uniref:transposase n=1 Tax=Streptosporangium sp. NPDC051022 TaxID=3155752 RepID=UPI003423E340
MRRRRKGGSRSARPKPWEVGDELWAVIEPLLPGHRRRTRRPGRKRLDDHHALQGVLFVPHIGIAWEHLPQALGHGTACPTMRIIAFRLPPVTVTVYRRVTR